MPCGYMTDQSPSQVGWGEGGIRALGTVSGRMVLQIQLDIIMMLQTFY